MFKIFSKIQAVTDAIEAFDWDGTVKSLVPVVVALLDFAKVFTNDKTDAKIDQLKEKLQAL